MASPMVDGRVEPHRKATYTLDVGEQMRREERGNGFSSVKYNHKPALASGTRSARTTTLQPSTAGTFSLALRDTTDDGDSDMFVFNGTRAAPTKSYVLLFDPTTQKATLDRLDSTYTFNLATHNGADVSSQHTTLYPKKPHKDSLHDRDAAAADNDLFGDTQDRGDQGMEPEPGNPYDFRHFLHAAKTKDAGDAGYASSPDARSTPATPAVPPARRAVEPLPKKRKAASVFAKKPTAKGAAKSGSSSKGVPTVHLERRASERPAPAPASGSTSTAKPKAKPKASAPSASRPTTAAPSSSKIKSAEFIASSDESDVEMDTTNENNVDMDVDVDVDAEGDPDSTLPSPHTQSQSHQHPHPHHTSSPSSDEDEEQEEEEEEEDTSHTTTLEIEVPDAHPHTPCTHSSHLHANTTRTLRSPSHGPISLASAASSVHNTPSRGRIQDEEIDFGDWEGDDGDTREERGAGNGNGNGNASKAEEVDDDDPLYMEMMEGLAGGDSSEESEEE